jgi:hypothetical protein
MRHRLLLTLIATALLAMTVGATIAIAKTQSPLASLTQSVAETNTTTRGQLHYTVSFCLTTADANVTIEDNFLHGLNLDTSPPNTQPRLVGPNTDRLVTATQSSSSPDRNVYQFQLGDLAAGCYTLTFAANVITNHYPSRTCIGQKVTNSVTFFDPTGWKGQTASDTPFGGDCFAFIGPFNTTDTIASTVPDNGDVNPYGVVVVPTTTGNLVKGNVLVSNFNNFQNHQGTGTTIVQIAPDGTQTLFAQLSANNLPGQCPGGVGLTTALVALTKGWVIVGSLPTSDGTSATAQAGCLIVLNNVGTPVETLSGGAINGPWDMTVFQPNADSAQLFLTNVLNGTVAGNGNVVKQQTVLRINLSVPDIGKGNPQEQSRTIIGSGFSARTDPTALVIGPTGVGLGSKGILYIADTLLNRIAAIPDALTRSTSAGTGQTVSTGGAINGQLGLAITPINSILVANGGDGNMVETTADGAQIAVKTVTPNGAGSLFGLAITPKQDGVYFVDDGDNKLKLFH